jgi:hypothetical protein
MRHGICLQKITSLHQIGEKTRQKKDDHGYTKSFLQLLKYI